MSGSQFETDRLILREWKRDDLEDFFEYAKIEGVGENAGWKHHKNIEESLEILKLFIEEKKTLAIVLKENSKVIGSIGLEEIRKEMKEEDLKKDIIGRELGYVLSKNYWGKGLMVEALKKLIEYCFKEQKYDFIICSYFNHNLQSKRVLEKVGFSYYKDTEILTRMRKVEKSTICILWNDSI